MRFSLGRHVFGLAAVGFGVSALVFHDFNEWQQIRPLGNIPYREILLYAVAAVEIFGGVAIQWPRTARAGALALGTIYLIFALLWVPLFIEKPRVYDSVGNFFEQFSLVSGALIVYASFDRSDPMRAAKLARIGYFCFGICVVSFTAGQVVYFSGVAGFVPKWIPPGQKFWATATTLAFALAAVALLSGRSALLASRLLTAMILGFGLLIWLPTLWVPTFFAAPGTLESWAGNAENLAIAAAAWIVADFLAQSRSKIS
jgi:uncharacterized membrane protein YphA (DoxX/SURF4 family)